MKTIGNKSLNPGIAKLSVENLRALERHMNSLHRLTDGVRHFFPKGIHRYKSHEEAEAAWLLAVARDMAELVDERDHGTG